MKRKEEEKSFWGCEIDKNQHGKWARARASDQTLGGIQQAVCASVPGKRWVTGPAWKKFTIRCRDLKRDGEVHAWELSKKRDYSS